MNNYSLLQNIFLGGNTLLLQTILLEFWGQKVIQIAFWGFSKWDVIRIFNNSGIRDTEVISYNVLNLRRGLL